MDSTEFPKSLIKAIPSIVVATGDSDLLFGETLQAYKKAISGSDEIAVVYFDFSKSNTQNSETQSGASGIKDVMSELDSSDFFSSTKLVVVENATAWLKQATDALTRYKAEPASGSYLLIRAQKATKASKFMKALNKEKAVVECASPKPWNIGKWIRSRANMRGLSLPIQVFNDLESYAGSDLKAIDSAFEKLELFLSNNNNASERELRELLEGSSRWSPLKLRESVADNNTELSLKIAESMMEQGTEQFGTYITDAQTVVHAAILPALRSEMKQGLDASIALERGETDTAYKVAGLSNPYNPRRNGFLNRMSKTSRFQWEKKLEAVLNAEVAIKQGLNLPLELLIDKLIITLCR